MPTQDAADYVSAAAPWVPTNFVRVDGTVAPWTARCAPAPAPCTLVIGVWGAVTSNFTLAVRPLASALTLQPGVPVVAPLSDPWIGGFVQTTFALPVPNNPAVLSVTMDITGLEQPIAVLWSSSLASAAPDPADPSTYCAVWAATTINENSFTTYSSDTACWCGFGSTFPGPCFAYARVFTTAPGGGGPPPAVAVVGTTGADAVVTLLDGVPTTAAITSGGNRYFVFYPAPSLDRTVLQTTVRVVLDPSLGDADLYITVDGSEPNSFHWDFASVRGVGPDWVDVNVTDPYVASFCNVTAPVGTPAACAIRICVNGWSRRARYSLVATFARYTTLLPGEPNVGYLTGPPPLAAFYRVDGAHPRDTLRIALAGLAGSPLMAGGNSSANATLAPRPSVPGSFGWGPAGPGLVELPPPAGGAPEPDFFVVGVAAPEASGGAGYALTATWGSGNATLVVGLPTVGAVSGGQYSYFVLPWPYTNVSGVGQVMLNMDGQTGASGWAG